MRASFRRLRAGAGVAVLAIMIGALVSIPLSPSPVAAKPGDEPGMGQLSLVPPDCLGFTHFQLADIWKHSMMKDLRATVAAAGPKALAAYEAQVYPPMQTLDQVTVFALPIEPNQQREPSVLALVQFSAPFDTAKILTLYLPNAEKLVANGKTYYFDPENSIGIYFPDTTHLMVGPGTAVGDYLKKPIVLRGAMSPALAEAATGKKAMYATLNIASLPIPPDAFRDVPEGIRPLFAADQLTLTMDLSTDDMKLGMKGIYAGEKSAGEAEDALKAAVAIAKAEMRKPRAALEESLFGNVGGGPRKAEDVAMLTAALVGLGGMNRIEEELKNLPIKREGNSLVASVSVPSAFTGIAGFYSAGIGLMLPAVQKVREAAGRSQGQNNLKQIALSMHNYESAYGKLPSSAICDKAGKPLLSWRVAILPYIEQDNLYRQFKLDEPWDSETNKKLIPLMPKIYACPRAPLPEGQTLYKVFVGNDAMFSLNKGTSLVQIPDGTSNTFMAVEGGAGVVWTKPEDINFDPKIALPSLELPGGGKMVSFAMGDGSVRTIDLAKVKEATLKLYIQKNDGMVIPE